MSIEINEFHDLNNKKIDSTNTKCYKIKQLIGKLKKGRLLIFNKLDKKFITEILMTIKSKNILLSFDLNKTYSDILKCINYNYTIEKESKKDSLMEINLDYFNKTSKYERTTRISYYK